MMTPVQDPSQAPQAATVEPGAGGSPEGGGGDLQSVVAGMDDGFGLLIDVLGASGAPEGATQELAGIQSAFQEFIMKLQGGGGQGSPANQSRPVANPDAAGGLPSSPAGV